MAFGLLVALLAFAPLFRGGNRPLPLAAMELAAVAGLVVLAWRGLGAVRPSIPPTLACGIALLFAVPLLQLVPLPFDWWAALPGHAPYANALGVAGPEAAAGMRPASLHPRATQYAWLAMLPPLAAFLLTLAQPRERIRTLAIVFVGIALLEALIGVMQLGAGRGSWLHFGNPPTSGLARGTYVNRNHFGALMACALPMAVALWGLQVVSPHRRGSAPLAHPRHADRRIAVHIVLSMLVLLLLVALFFSHSRGAIGAGFLAFALASLALVWRTGSAPARLAFGLVAAGALVFAAWIGLTPVIERFAPEDLSLGYDGRAAIAAAAIRGGLDFLPLGSGLGTFADAFRRYQPEALGGFVDHAHNDYAELFMELGVAGLAVIALFAAAFAARWARVARPGRGGRVAQLQAAAGLGMLAMALHSVVEFNFHIPANAVYFAFLAGIFFYADPAATPPGGGRARGGG